MDMHHATYTPEDQANTDVQPSASQPSAKDALEAAQDKAIREAHTYAASQFRHYKFKLEKKRSELAITELPFVREVNGVLKYWAPYYKTGCTSEAQDAAYCMGVRYAEMLMVALRNDADAVLVKRVIQEAYAANAATKKPSMVVVGFIYQIEEATLAGLRLFKTTL